MTATPASDDRYRLLIGDEWVRPADAYAIVNPGTEQVVGLAPEASAEQARAAAAAAREAQPTWAALGMEEGCRLLRLAVDALRERLPAFVSLVLAETGSTLAVARMQIDVAADRVGRYARPRSASVARPRSFFI